MASRRSPTQEPEFLSGRQFKLISVNLKEAVLDSPSFRASVNHLDIQLDNIEKWVDAVHQSIEKVPRYVKDLELYLNSFVEHLSSSFLADGLINQEYTVQALHTSVSALKDIYKQSIVNLTMSPQLTEDFRATTSKRIAEYREIRKRFAASQEKYDMYLNTYAAHPKVMDPTQVYEDAQHLYQVRKEYIHNSLDLIVELASISAVLDKLVIKLINKIWKKKLPKNKSLLIASGSASEIWEKVLQYNSWNAAYSSAFNKLSADLLSARVQVEESTALQLKPSSNINDYKPSSINKCVLEEINEPECVKHGYLFMKTWMDKSNKPIWVRRWVFVKNGVFGLLVLSPSKTFVQETDKIGVLLTNVRYAPNEERRFCFEIKTMDLTLVFQAETLHELKSWLKVFQNEQQRVIDGKPENEALYNLASGRYPPLVTEFANKNLTIMDRALTNTKITNNSGLVIVSTNLSTRIEKSLKFFLKYMYIQIPTIRPPFVTDQTKSSIISYSITAASTVPTALSANVWGTINWGLQYIHDVTNSDDEISVKGFFPSSSDSFSDMYPSYYPKELVPLDIQMKALFETAVEPGDLCLISFKCFWSPNSRQELCGRAFVTANHIYFYMQIMGFVALVKSPMSHNISADYSIHKDYQSLRIYTVDGNFRMKLYLEETKLIKDKFVFLVHNVASDKPKQLQEIIEHFTTLEIDYKKQKEQAKKAKALYELGDLPTDDKVNPSTFIKASTNEQKSFKVDFTDLYQKIIDSEFDVPPKVLLHAFLGDYSVLKRSAFSFMSLERFSNKPWHTDKDGKLVRSFTTRVRTTSTEGEIKGVQKIDEFVDDEYYTFTHEASLFELFIGSKFVVEYQFVLVRSTRAKTRLVVYCNIKFLGNLIFNLLTKNFVCGILKMEALDTTPLFNRIVSDVGTHGMAVKAIYLYGKLSKTDEPVEDNQEPPPVFYFGSYYIFIHLFRSFLIYSITVLKKVVIDGVQTLYHNINKLLILVIIILELYNMWLTKTSIVSYWAMRQAKGVVDSYLSEAPTIIHKAVHLQDIVEPMKVNLSSSSVYREFYSKSLILSDGLLDEDYGDLSTRNIARSLRSSYDDIAVERYALMVKLRMLNQLESELVKAEWENWIRGEHNRCQSFRESIVAKVPSEDLAASHSSLSELINYCDVCAEEFKEMNLV
ncbi:SNF1-interacting protein [Scheffersomyces spartinae]|uniref:SNF1-interacting protein n=1 Tax=Scheffersomyces spartinae TaxID=45513 RepID=A0A9P7V6R7_9ASCO|nr:SNF1-interacting protein [Scheffersomyces spartinae]KAG7192413.1 SNF1-interacting protein [Scheffersomyces spartinae]